MFGNYTRFGLPDDDKEWKLTYEKNQRSTNSGNIAIRQCLKCYKVYKGSQPICPYCGNDNGKTREQIKQEEKAELERIEKIQKYQRKNEIWQCQTIGELINYAKSKGYKNPSGWAYYIIQARKKKARKH